MSAFDTLVAATTEEIHATWADYVRYLEAHLQLLDSRDAAAPAFERDAADDVLATAQATLAAIAPSRRARFDAVLEQERQHTLLAVEAEHAAAGGRGPLDPDAVERTLLHRLLDEARGIGTPTPGRGWVPLAPEKGEWYEVDVQALDDAPQASAYLLRGADEDDRRRTLIQAASVATVALLALLGWWLWPSAQALRVAADLAPTVNGQVAETWPLRAIVVSSGTTTITVPVSATTAAAWPESDTATAFWRSPSLFPLTICLPNEHFVSATQVQLISDGALPVRSYALQPTTGTPDLRVEPCTGGSGPELAPRLGALQAVVLPVPQPVGEAVTLGNAELTVQSIVQEGLGDDPTLPPNVARVVVTVITTALLDWPRLAPTLVLPDGQALNPSTSNATSDGVVFQYLVPQRPDALPVLWQLTPPDGGPAMRWRTVLAPPPTRLAVLRERLHVERVDVNEATERALTVSMVLRNTSTTPLALVADDLHATVDERPLSLPSLAALQSPLAPDEARTLTLMLPRAPDDGALVVALGPYRYAIHHGKES
jgi:hypothetical protein